MKSNATRFSHDLTGVMPVPEVTVTRDDQDRPYANVNIVGYTLGTGWYGHPLVPEGGHVQVALYMHAYYAARMLLTALERLEAAYPGVTATVKQAPMEAFLLDPPAYAAAP